ncbi:MAG: hypothetical protein ACREP7_16140 [Lysobacter sp.]
MALRIRRALLRWAAVCCLGVGTGAFAQTPGRASVDVAAFAARDSFVDLKQPPGGDYYAATVPLEQEQGPDSIVAYDTVDKTRTEVWRDPVADPERIIYRQHSQIPVGAFFYGQGKLRTVSSTRPRPKRISTRVWRRPSPTARWS